ncbi:hypothetical protein Rsub_09149 [Raphidocelis subcapitata]|uniref:MGS-like domain-containing protein n=1 Tax=Raphidocelis subcapitata TaxID=307507 RepID=A0A2V0P9P7_9CHLO|nr:hypothetical protein Rsub_09149 [Raphidocelis subcapitata]|eukprot:GBF96566.1 hypothetical protein Rsub_09149 [Raphidocelis subcapitata]
MAALPCSSSRAALRASASRATPGRVAICGARPQARACVLSAARSSISLCGPAAAAPPAAALRRQPARAGRMSVMAMAAAAQKRALVSVSDKTGLDQLAKGLAALGFELVSTGGSAKAIEAAGVAVKKVEDLTGFPEMLDGRVKTLHPGVHGGILAIRDNATHMAALAKHDISTIDLDVAVVVDPSDYEQLLEALKPGASPAEGLAFRKRLAWKAYQHTASYDSQVAEWLWGQVGAGEPAPAMSVPMTLTQGLRYGENPHQSAAFYVDDSLAEHNAGGVATAVQHNGKEMSYNNYLDADAAYVACCDFKEPTCVIVKHTNPCGVATRGDLLEAYRLAVRADPISAFGGIVAFNRPVDAELAREIREFRSPTDGETRMFYEIGKSKTLRILEAKARAPSGRQLRQVAGGWLQQGADDLSPEDITFTVVSEKQPTPQQLEDLKFAWRCVKHVKSNAIAVAKGGRMLGMGSGQPNRVKSTEIALEKAGSEATGSVLASDAFFPFTWGDSVEKACQAGVAAIAHPGGSMRDQDAVDCCNKYGVVLVTTGVRHFKH